MSDLLQNIGNLQTSCVAVMNRNCPNCQTDLTYKRLKATPVKIKERGGRVPRSAPCPECKSLLTINHNPSEIWAGVSFAIFFAAFASTFNYVERKYAVYIGSVLIFSFGIGMAWFYKVYLRHWNRWKLFEES